MFDKGRPKSENKSLAEIVREMTDDGSLIVRFLVDLMQDKGGDAKPCHRLEATEQLLDFGFSWNLADFILEKTDDGRLIVRFLMDVLRGKIDDVTDRDRVVARQFLSQVFNGKTWITLPTPPEQ